MALLETLIDNFNDNSIDPKWSPFATAGASVTETGGQLVLYSGPGVTQAQISPVDYLWQFVNSYLQFKVTSVAPTGDLNTLSQVLLYNSDVGSDYIRILVNASNIIVAYYDSGGMHFLWSATWNATTYAWWKLREAGGTKYFDTSTDGLSWTNRTSWSGTSTYTNSQPFWMSISSGGGAATFAIDNVNFFDTTLAPNDMAHATTSDNLDLTQDHQLLPADMAHATTSDTPTLIENVTLTVADMAHATTIDNVDVDGSIQLVVADMAHAATSDNVALTQVHNLTVNDMAHAATAASPVVIVVYYLEVNDMNHATILDNVAVAMVLRQRPQPRVFIENDPIKFAEANTQANRRRPPRII